MQKIEYNDKVYYYNNGRFMDSSFLEVDALTKNKLAEIVFSKVDYEHLTKNELLNFIKEIKNANMYGFAKNICIFCLKRYREDLYLIKSILPIITSCYRMCGQSEKAINILNEYNLTNKYESVAFLTSLAASYCDVKDYENAMKYANRAYAKQCEEPDTSFELSLVYKRIKKEMGENN